MQTEKIIKIGKEIIYIAGFYKNYSPDEKKKIDKKLASYRAQLEGSENIYSKKLITFLDDLHDDLEKNKPLQIDNLFEDDFVGNYYESSKQVKIYNSLINIEIYKNILKNENKQKNNELFEKFYLDFRENFKKLDYEKISNLLLIFTIFEIISPKKYLSRIYDFRKKFGFSFKNIEKLKNMIKSFEIFLEKLYKISVKNLNEKNISYKYIKISKDGEEKDFQLKFLLKDASKDLFRTGDYLYEYRQLVKNLKK